MNKEIEKARHEERIKVYDELHVLHGEDARKFLEDMARVDAEMTPELRKEEGEKAKRFLEIMDKAELRGGKK